MEENTSNVLDASDLDLQQRTILHSLLCRAFRDLEVASDVAEALGLRMTRGLAVDTAWLQIIDRLCETKSNVAPLIQALLAVRPWDPAWYGMPNIAVLRQGAQMPATKIRDEVSGRRLIAKLYCDGVDGWGTAWQLGRQRVLTAAHCVGDRVRHHLSGGDVRLEFIGSESHAVVRDVDWDLDVALLELSERSTQREVPALLDEVKQDDPWRVWGFPFAMPTGMVAEGTVADPFGKLPTGTGTEVAAMQLTCQQGGHGALDGLSGAPVWGRSGIIGLVRYGPERLRQRVIYATKMSDVIARFKLSER